MQENKEQHIQYIKDDTVELKDIFALIIKRSKMIVLVTAVLTLSAIAYVFFIATPVYEAKALLQLAIIDKVPLGPTQNIKLKIETIYDVGAKNVVAPQGTSNMLSIVTNGYDNASAEKKLLLVINSVMEEQQKYLIDYEAMRVEELFSIQNRIKEKEGRLKSYQDYFDKLPERFVGVSKKDADVFSMLLIEQEKEKIKRGMEDLTDQLFDLKKSSSEIKEKLSFSRMEGAKIIGGVKLLDRPIKPKKMLIVSLAFITGLILSLLLAFSLEFISDMKKKDEEKKS